MKTWTPKGTYRLLLAAVEFFCSSTGVPLPYNLAGDGPDSRFPISIKLVEYWDCFVRAVRFSGWLRAAAGIPEIVRLIRRTQSTNGVGSPATAMSLWQVAERHPSPHRAARFLARLRERANQVLSGYGLRVSWRALGITLAVGPRQLGKAAVYAAAVTVRQFWYKSFPEGLYFEQLWREQRDGNGYRHARRFLERIHGWQQAVNFPVAVRKWACEKLRAGEFFSLVDAWAASTSRLEAYTVEEITVYADKRDPRICFRGVSLIKVGSDGLPYWLVKRDSRLAIAYHGLSPAEAAEVAANEWEKQDALAQGCPIIKLLDEIWECQWDSSYWHDEIDWKKWAVISSGKGQADSVEFLPNPPFVVVVEKNRCYKQHSPEGSVTEFFIGEKKAPRYFPNSKRGTENFDGTFVPRPPFADFEELFLNSAE